MEPGPVILSLAAVVLYLFLVGAEELRSILDEWWWESEDGGES